MLCANGQFILFFNEFTNGVSVWDFTVGKRFNLPTLLDSANHQIRIRAAVFCTDSTKGTHRITLLGTNDKHNTVNNGEYEDVVTVWNLLEDYNKWDVRCNKSEKVEGFDPRSMAFYKGKIWVAMESGEILVSDDTQDTPPELHAVPTSPNNLEAVKSAKNNKMDLDYPYLPSAGKSDPDYAFSGFVHHRDGLYLLASFVVYKLWEATDVLGRVSYTFRQTKDIEGATFIVQECSQGYGYYSSQSENSDLILIAKNAVMRPNQPRAATHCLAYDIISKKISVQVWCSENHPCTCQHCWVI